MPNRQKIAEIIRVNHAGEMGAKVIYDGQIIALKIKRDEKTLKIIEEMKRQECQHFDYFDEFLKKNKTRPTLMQPIWEIGGFALGFITALVDKKAAMVCTTAVEEVIDEHYLQQIKDLEYIQKNSANIDDKIINNLQENIKKFREEEIQHRDIGYENNARDFIAYKALSGFIKLTTKFAINISKKI